jgi:hypothetical protein
VAASLLGLANNLPDKCSIDCRLMRWVHRTVLENVCHLGDNLEDRLLEFVEGAELRLEQLEGEKVAHSCA